MDIRFRMTLSDLEWFSNERSIARPLHDTWASWFYPTCIQLSVQRYVSELSAPSSHRRHLLILGYIFSACCWQNPSRFILVWTSAPHKYVYDYDYDQVQKTRYVVQTARQWRVTAIQDHPRSLKLEPIDIPCVISYSNLEAISFHVRDIATKTPEIIVFTYHSPV